MKLIRYLKFKNGVKISKFKLLDYSELKLKTFWKNGFYFKFYPQRNFGGLKQ